MQVGSWSFVSNNNGGYGNFTTNPVAVRLGANSVVLIPGFSSYAEEQARTEDTRDPA